MALRLRQAGAGHRHPLRRRAARPRGIPLVLNAGELASGTDLARSFCAYVALFWGIRLCLQPVFDVKAHLTARWLKAGYFALTVLFAFFTVVYGYAAWRTPG